MISSLLWLAVVNKVSRGTDMQMALRQLRSIATKCYSLARRLQIRRTVALCVGNSNLDSVQRACPAAAQPAHVRGPPAHRAAAGGVPHASAPRHRHGARQRGCGPTLAQF